MTPWPDLPGADSARCGCDVAEPMGTFYGGLGTGGGDRFLAGVAGSEVEATHGDQMRGAWAGAFDELIGEVQPFEGAVGLRLLARLPLLPGRSPMARASR